MRFFAICAIFCAQLAYASLGDRLIIYDNLLQSCLKRNCSSSNALEKFESRQPFYLKLFGWDCVSECKFQSQWSTLVQLKRSNVVTIPQFYGKWPFYRFLGIQEPASFFFSIMNFSSNLYGWFKYRNITAKRDPMYSVWKLQMILTLLAWFFSTLYHARESPLSEKLDYFSAFAMIISSLWAITIKLLSVYVSRPTMYMSISLPFISFYFYHIYYLHSVHFDYGYNMKVNVITGFLSTFCWFIWCFKYWKVKRHVWKCIVCLLCVNLCLLFELMDFPPFAFTFDAHSLWHLCTFPLPLLWFDFLTAEAIHLASGNDGAKKKLA